MIALHFLIRNRYTKLINHLASTSVYRVHQVCIFFVQKGFPRTIRQNPSGPIISPDRELSNRCYLFSLFMAPARFLYLTQVSTFHGLFPLVISFFIFIQQLFFRFHWKFYFICVCNSFPRDYCVDQSLPINFWVDKLAPTGIFNPSSSLCPAFHPRLVIVTAIRTYFTSTKFFLIKLLTLGSQFFEYLQVFFTIH